MLLGTVCEFVARHGAPPTLERRVKRGGCENQGQQKDGGGTENLRERRPNKQINGGEGVKRRGYENEGQKQNMK